MTASLDGPLSLKDAVQQTLDEARMVLPGIQALFGFQLIVVFSDGFQRRLASWDQVLHLVAVALIALAIGLVMAPAAYHRQVQPRRVDKHLLAMASRFVTAALAPLALGLSLDIYLVAHVILDRPGPSAVLGAATFAGLVGLWFAYPRWMRRRRGMTSGS